MNALHLTEHGYPNRSLMWMKLGVQKRFCATVCAGIGQKRPTTKNAQYCQFLNGSSKKCSLESLRFQHAIENEKLYLRTDTPSYLYPAPPTPAELEELKDPKKLRKKFDRQWWAYKRQVEGAIRLYRGHEKGEQLGRFIDNFNKQHEQTGLFIEPLDPADFPGLFRKTRYYYRQFFKGIPYPEQEAVPRWKWDMLDYMVVPDWFIYSCYITVFACVWLEWKPGQMLPEHKEMVVDAGGGITLDEFLQNYLSQGKVLKIYFYPKWKRAVAQLKPEFVNDDGEGPKFHGDFGKYILMDLEKRWCGEEGIFQVHLRKAIKRFGLNEYIPIIRPRLSEKKQILRYLAGAIFFIATSILWWRLAFAHTFAKMFRVVPIAKARPKDEHKFNMVRDFVDNKF